MKNPVRHEGALDEPGGEVVGIAVLGIDDVPRLEAHRIASLETPDVARVVVQAALETRVRVDSVHEHPHALDVDVVSVVATTSEYQLHDLADRDLGEDFRRRLVEGVSVRRRGVGGIVESPVEHGKGTVERTTQPL